MEFLPSIIMFVVIVALTGTAGWALWWAIKTGQFANFEKGATSIFDDEEPLGRPTDAFPDRKPENLK